MVIQVTRRMISHLFFWGVDILTTRLEKHTGLKTQAAAVRIHPQFFRPSMMGLCLLNKNLIWQLQGLFSEAFLHGSFIAVIGLWYRPAIPASLHLVKKSCSRTSNLWRSATWICRASGTAIATDRWHGNPSEARWKIRLRPPQKGPNKKTKGPLKKTLEKKMGTWPPRKWHRVLAANLVAVMMKMMVIHSLVD
jgi:hypothetical protein